MENDPAVLFVKPKAISAKDKSALKGAGVIVVEVEDPASVKFVRPSAELSSGALMRCAMNVITETSSGYVREAFGRAVAEAILALPPPPLEKE